MTYESVMPVQAFVCPVCDTFHESVTAYEEACGRVNIECPVCNQVDSFIKRGTSA